MIVAASLNRARNARSRGNQRYGLARAENIRGIYRFIPPEREMSRTAPGNIVGGIETPRSPVTDGGGQTKMKGCRRPSSCTTIPEGSSWRSEAEEHAALGTRCTNRPNQEILVPDWLITRP
eukprot:sb/3476044/